MVQQQVNNVKQQLLRAIRVYHYIRTMSGRKSTFIVRIFVKVGHCRPTSETPFKYLCNQGPDRIPVSWIASQSIFLYRVHFDVLTTHANIAEQERASCPTLIVFMLSCGCQCSEPLPLGAMACSEICNCDVAILTRFQREFLNQIYLYN